MLTMDETRRDNRHCRSDAHLRSRSGSDQRVSIQLTARPMKDLDSEARTITIGVALGRDPNAHGPFHLVTECLF